MHQRQPLVLQKEFDSCFVQIVPLMHRRRPVQSNTCSIHYWLAMFGGLMCFGMKPFAVRVLCVRSMKFWHMCLFLCWLWTKNWQGFSCHFWACINVLTVIIVSFVASLCVTNPNVSFTKFLWNWQKTWICWWMCLSKKNRGLFPGAQSSLSGARASGEFHVNFWTRSFSISLHKSSRLTVFWN